MGRILLIIAALVVVVAAGAFVYAGENPPAPHVTLVTHDVPVSQLVSAQ